MKNLTRVIIALFSFTIFANFFFFRDTTALSLGLFWLGLSIYIVGVAQYRHKSMWILVITSIYAVFTLWMRAANFIQIQSVLAIIAATASLWYISISESESFGSFTTVFLSPFFAGLTYIKRAFSLIKPTTLNEGYKRAILLLGDRHTHSRSISTLIGLAIALPVMFILVTMFASADPIYYSYLKNIVSSNFLQELPWRIVLSFLLMVVVIPFVYPKIRRVFFSPGQALGRFQMTHELTIVMGVVAVVIASFIVIQWPYVFANVKAEVDLSQFGVATYAEYVKKGFIELLRVSAFIYALLWLGLTTLRREVLKKRSRALSVLQWVVMGEFMIILISIARRVYLYQMYHGLTLIRVYGSFFLVWLVCMALTLAGRHITNKLRFGTIEGILTIFLFIILGAWNVEGYIATAHPPTVNKRVDYVYLSRMSADGVDGWIQAYTHSKEVIEKYTNMSGELDKDARREIAYAYYIIRRLTYQEYDYMNKYATPTEMQTYINTVVDFQKGRLDKERSELQRYQIVRPPNEDWTKTRIAEITQIQNNLEKIKTQKLTTPSPTMLSGENYSDVSIGTWQELRSFDAPLAPKLLSFYDSYNSVYYPNSPGGGTVVERYVKITSLDRLYMKNVSDMSAFEIMKRHIPLDQLHTLQTQYFELYSRIGRQSTRDYERDISLESPLL